MCLVLNIALYMVYCSYYRPHPLITRPYEWDCTVCVWATCSWPAVYFLLNVSVKRMINRQVLSPNLLRRRSWKWTETEREYASVRSWFMHLHQTVRFYPSVSLFRENSSIHGPMKTLSEAPPGVCDITAPPTTTKTDPLPLSVLKL